MTKRYLITFLLLSIQSLVFAQIPTGNQLGGLDDKPFFQEEDTVKQEKRPGRKILDDSTKLVYGPHTTQYFYQDDWFENRTVFNVIDTGLTNLHRYNYVARNGYASQDLGTLGTAIKPLYFQVPAKLGTRLGLNYLAPYLVTPEKVRYFNSKSPYTDWYYAQGGGKRSILDIEFARNINPNWSAGFLFHRITSRILAGQHPQGSRRDNRQGDHQTFLMHTSYHSPNGKYKIMGHFSAFTHTINETGGIQVQSLLDENRDYDDLFTLDRAEFINQLKNVKTYQRQSKIHLYHEYSLLDSTTVQLFQEVDLDYNKFWFGDENLSENLGFYENIGARDLSSLSQLTSTYNQILFNEVNHRIGVKGRKTKFFYALYHRFKRYKLNHEITLGSRVPIKLKDQHFLGGILDYQLSQDMQLRIESEASLGKNYFFSGLFNYKYLEGKFTRSVTEPTYMSSFYSGSLFYWDNDFESSVADKLYGAIKIPTEKLFFKPYVEVTNLNNYIYYDTASVPQQSGESISYLQVGFDLNYTTGKFHHTANALYTLHEDQDILRMPEFFANYQVYYERSAFNDNLHFQIGLDFHWHSAFYADAYNPVVQQFYLQDRQKVGNYVQADAFVNYRISRVRMFIKFTNIMEGMIKNGYYVTPNYMGQARQFEFGVHWLLFD
ncbi:putative porin [Rapidithrix thailandica]|uniref:Porin n=1 Tax=Rapidithrix thailandica TaxID=413964 RepID=A0AAW9SKG3_9BACT